MSGRAIRTLGKALGDRAMGNGPGPFRAAAAATVTGAATWILTYRLLRGDNMFGAGDQD
jgi:hypothetical protein